MKFTVTIKGEVDMEPDPEPRAEANVYPEPTDEDREKAAILAGTTFNKDVADIFAQGIAVARNGGSVEAFLRERLKKPDAK